jgi:hypothetical protein
MSEEWTPNLIYDKEIDDWLATCPTHKYEVEWADEYGIHVSIRFNNMEELDD